MQTESQCECVTCLQSVWWVSCRSPSEHLGLSSSSTSPCTRAGVGSCHSLLWPVPAGVRQHAIRHIPGKLLKLHTALWNSFMLCLSKESFLEMFDYTCERLKENTQHNLTRKQQEQIHYRALELCLRNSSKQHDSTLKDGQIKNKKQKNCVLLNAESLCKLSFVNLQATEHCTNLRHIQDVHRTQENLRFWDLKAQFKWHESKQIMQIIKRKKKQATQTVWTYLKLKNTELTSIWSIVSWYSFSRDLKRHSVSLITFSRQSSW